MGDNWPLRRWIAVIVFFIACAFIASVVRGNHMVGSAGPPGSSPGWTAIDPERPTDFKLTIALGDSSHGLRFMVDTAKERCASIGYQLDWTPWQGTWHGERIVLMVYVCWLPAGAIMHLTKSAVAGYIADSRSCPNGSEEGVS